MQIADRQQQFFMDNKSYTGDLTDLEKRMVVRDDESS